MGEMVRQYRSLESALKFWTDEGGPVLREPEWDTYHPSSHLPIFPSSHDNASK